MTTRLLATAWPNLDCLMESTRWPTAEAVRPSTELERGMAGFWAAASSESVSLAALPLAASAAATASASLRGGGARQCG